MRDSRSIPSTGFAPQAAAAWITAAVLLAGPALRAERVAPLARVDGQVTDLHKDGGADSVEQGLPLVRVAQSASLAEACVFEFDLSFLPPGATIGSAGLVIQLDDPDAVQGGDFEQHLVFGYAADGVIDAADYGAGQRLQRFDPADLVPSDDNPEPQISIPADFIQGLLDNGGAMAGFVVREEIDAEWMGHRAVTYAALGDQRHRSPRLQVVYEGGTREPGPALFRRPSYSTNELGARNLFNLAVVDKHLYQEDTVCGPPPPTNPANPENLASIQLLGVPVMAGEDPNVDVDGLSYDHAVRLENLMAFFSVDGRSAGLADTDVSRERAGGVGEIVADIFWSEPAPDPNNGTNRQVWDGNGSQAVPDVGPSPSLGQLERDESAETDALDMREAPTTARGSFIYWTVSRGTVPRNAAVFGGLSGAHIFVSVAEDHYSAGDPLHVFATPGQMALSGDNDIDALVVVDDGQIDPATGMPVFDPNIDEVYLSLDRDSEMFRWTDFSAADILRVGAGQPLHRFAAPAALGLAEGDNIDALDLVNRDEVSPPVDAKR